MFIKFFKSLFGIKNNKKKKILPNKNKKFLTESEIPTNFLEEENTLALFNIGYVERVKNYIVVASPFKQKEDI